MIFRGFCETIKVRSRAFFLSSKIALNPRSKFEIITLCRSMLMIKRDRVRWNLISFRIHIQSAFKLLNFDINVMSFSLFFFFLIMFLVIFINGIQIVRLLDPTDNSLLMLIPTRRCFWINLNFFTNDHVFRTNRTVHINYYFIQWESLRCFVRLFTKTSSITLTTRQSGNISIVRSICTEWLKMYLSAPPNLT